jgi:hypothetical protein
LSSDLLEARVRAVQARLLSGEALIPAAAPDKAPQTPLGALAARARAVQARMAEAYAARRSAGQSRGGGGVRGSVTQPMATAPRDGQLVRLWLRDGTDFIGYYTSPSKDSPIRVRR